MLSRKSPKKSCSPAPAKEPIKLKYASTAKPREAQYRVSRKNSKPALGASKFLSQPKFKRRQLSEARSRQWSRPRCEEDEDCVLIDELASLRKRIGALFSKYEYLCS